MSEVLRSDDPEWVQQFYRCSIWIDAALSVAGHTHDLEDVFQGVAMGDYQFWWHPDGCGVTEVLDYPRFRVLHLWLVGGTMEAMEELEARAAEWGRQQGCSRATLTGRRGWARSFLADRGYKTELVMMSKELV